jgi:prepilin-type N-terminal cleavage/methylation domain-containing protein
MKNAMTTNKGFTLVELMIAIAIGSMILLCLAGIAVAAYVMLT